jgi:hypothetical protein
MTHPVFAKEEFEIDLGAGTVTCPAGKVAGIGSPGRNGRRTAHFRRSDCLACELKPRCTQRRAAQRHPRSPARIC